MSIEFGILREGSTITLIGNQRAIVDEEVFDELEALFSKVHSRTGVEIDKYSGSSFEGSNLEIFIEEIEKALVGDITPEIRETLLEVMRVAKNAKETKKALSYFGE